MTSNQRPRQSAARQITCGVCNGVERGDAVDAGEVAWVRFCRAHPGVHLICAQRMRPGFRGCPMCSRDRLATVDRIIASTNNDRDDTERAYRICANLGSDTLIDNVEALLYSRERPSAASNEKPSPIGIAVMSSDVIRRRSAMLSSATTSQQGNGHRLQQQQEHQRQPASLGSLRTTSGTRPSVRQAHGNVCGPMGNVAPQPGIVARQHKQLVNLANGLRQVGELSSNDIAEIAESPVETIIELIKARGSIDTMASVSPDLGDLRLAIERLLGEETQQRSFVSGKQCSTVLAKLVIDLGYDFGALCSAYTSFDWDTALAWGMDVTVLQRATPRVIYTSLGVGFGNVFRDVFNSRWRLVFEYCDGNVERLLSIGVVYDTLTQYRCSSLNEFAAFEGRSLIDALALTPARLQTLLNGTQVSVQDQIQGFRWDHATQQYFYSRNR